MKKFMVAFALVAAMVSMTGCGSREYTANDRALVDRYNDVYEVSWTDKEGEEQTINFEDKDDALDFAQNSLHANEIVSNFDY